jgi:Domain of unknown function (DUF4349)
MEPHRDDEFVAVLESLRPEPDQEFAAQLDERAAAGFPRPARERRARLPFRRSLRRLRTTPPRRLLLPAGCLIVTAIAVATAAIALNESDSTPKVVAAAPQVIRIGGGGKDAEVEEEVASSSASNPSEVAGNTTRLAKPEVQVGDSCASGTAGCGAHSKFDGSFFSQGSGSNPAAAGKTSGVQLATELLTSGPYASRARHRDVERAAEVTLGTDPSEVGDASGKVLESVHASDGVVLNSSVHGGSEGTPSARFELLIPSAKLSDALASFSEIAEVRARHESSNDITAPTVTTGELLQDSHARIESLLNQLASAETETEREAVEAKLRAERRHAASLKAQLTSLQRRANLSRVSLRIVSDEAPPSGAGGGWDAGDALHDAGHVLSVAAGVTILALAILAPIALIALLVWLAYRAWLRARRERALG